MKKILLLAILFLTGAMIIWSQVPQAMTYKAVAKDDWGVALPNKTITLRFTILQGSGTGSTVYQETHTTVTNKFGLMDVEIGKGTSVIGSFDMIDWSIGIYYIQIEMDPNGGTNFRLEDPAHQLLSVPYALFAESSGNASFTESDPVFAASSSSGIWSSDIFNWNTAFSWGNHANEGYLKGFTESDPLFLLHPAHGIAIDNINNWNAAFSWGNHAGLYKPLDYSPAWSEITGNPFLLSSPEANQLLKYNSVTEKWENWTPAYLTEEADGSITNELQNLILSWRDLSISGGNKVTFDYWDIDFTNDVTVDNDHTIKGNNKHTGINYFSSPVHFTSKVEVPTPIYPSDAASKAYVDALESRIAALEVAISGLITDQDGDGYTVCEGDCNDNDAVIYPGAFEICSDGIDQDCDGEIDEGCSNICYYDEVAGHWRYGDCYYAEEGCGGTVLYCINVEDNDNDTYTVSEGDCNDNNPFINPSALEICNDKVDNNCDGNLDSGCSYTNQIQNGDFESWSNTYIPDYWISDGGVNTSCSRSIDAIHGDYSLLITDNASDYTISLRQEIYATIPSELYGKKVILSIWVKKSESSGASIGQVSITDGINSSEFAFPVNQFWQLVHVEHTITNLAPYLQIIFSPTSESPMDIGSYFVDWGEMVVEGIDI